MRRVENDGALEKTYYNSRKIFDEFMLAQEFAKQGSLALFAGSCVDCPLEKCARLGEKECPFNNKMRTSLEALGFDVSKIAKDVFNTEILWSSNNSQPTYTTLVAGLFFD